MHAKQRGPQKRNHTFAMKVGFGIAIRSKEDLAKVFLA